MHYPIIMRTGHPRVEGENGVVWMSDFAVERENSDVFVRFRTKPPPPIFGAA